MSLTPQDLQSIKTIVDDTVRISTDILRQEIKASENRVITQLRQETDKKIDSLEHRLVSKIDENEDRILQGVSDTLDAHVYPKFDDHERRLTKLETKTA
jgi:hypothetical protein